MSHGRGSRSRGCRNAPGLQENGAAPTFGGVVHDGAAPSAKRSPVSKAPDTAVCNAQCAPRYYPHRVRSMGRTAHLSKPEGSRYHRHSQWTSHPGDPSERSPVAPPGGAVPRDRARARPAPATRLEPPISLLFPCVGVALASSAWGAVAGEPLAGSVWASAGGDPARGRSGCRLGGEPERACPARRPT